MPEKIDERKRELEKIEEIRRKIRYAEETAALCKKFRENLCVEGGFYRRKTERGGK